MSKLKELVKEAIELFRKIEEEVEKDTTTPDTEVPVTPDPPVVVEPTEPEIVRNIIAKFPAYNGDPFVYPANEDNSFVDDEGNTVPFTIRIPLLINENDTGFIVSKSDRQLGAEWGLRIHKGNLQFEMSRNSNAHDKIRVDIPLNKLPKDWFDLVLPIDYSGDNRSVNTLINARRVSHGASANSFTGFEKTSAPIRVGSNGWNQELFTGQAGEIIVEKGIAWKTDEIIEAYQNLFNIANLFIEPSEDGKVHIPVTPNTGQEVGFDLLEAFRRVRNGSDVVVDKGNYLVNMAGADYSQAIAAIELYGKEDVTKDFKDALLYTTQFSTDDLSGDGSTKRVQLSIIDSKNINVKNLNIKGAYNPKDRYLAAVAFEHGISNTHSDNLVYENITVKNVAGDGIYFKFCNNVLVKNVIADGINRMGAGVSHGCHNIKFDGFEAYNCTRASIDLEGDGTYSIIDGVEITNCYLTTYLAAGGNSRINNVNIHHNRWIKNIIMKGNMWTKNPEYNPELEESESNPRNLSLEPRENWFVEDNELIGGGGTPMAMVRIRYCKNVKVNRNNILVPTTQGRWGIDLNYCSGRIEIIGNKYENPCIHRILNCAAGTEVIIDEPNNDNVYIIEIDGVKEVRGTNPELLALIEKKGY